LRWQSVQESEDPSVPLSILCLCVDVLYLIFNYFCHFVAQFVSCFDDESGGSEVVGGAIFRPHVRSRTVQWPSVPIS